MQAWVGTSQSNIYCINLGDFSTKLVTTCHFDCITDIKFPQYVQNIITLLCFAEAQKCNRKVSYIYCYTGGCTASFNT